MPLRGAHYAGNHSKEIDRNRYYSTEGTPETPLAANGLEQHHSSPKGSWVRIVVYVLLVTAVGLAAWLIYENHQKAAAASASQAAALMNRPVPVQVACRRAEAHADLPDRAGHGYPLHERYRQARVSGELDRCGSPRGNR